MSNNSLVRMKLEKSLTATSLKDLVRVKDTENVFLLLDCSGSMADYIDYTKPGAKRRIDGLREVVTSLQTQRTTRMIAFGPLFTEPGLVAPGEYNAVADGPGCVSFVEEVPEPGGGTPLTEAIQFAKYNGAGRLLLISDGIPNDTMGAMQAAREFGGRIDVVFVGMAGDRGSIFLEELAKLTGGQRFEGDMTDTKELTGTVMALLTGDVLEEDDDDDDDDEEDEDDEESDDE